MEVERVRFKAAATRTDNDNKDDVINLILAAVISIIPELT